MEGYSNAEVTAPSEAPRRRARWFLALGVVLLLLGLASAGATTLLAATSLVLFGPLLLASSISQLVVALFAEKGPARLLHFAAAGLEMILGFLLMLQPFRVISDLVVLIAVLLMAIGLLRLGRSLVMRSPGRGWALMAAAGAIVLGICIWLQLPVAGIGLVGLCIALDFICHGVSWSALALVEGKAGHEPWIPT
jgi:uncharacterized membrane protein HdeD (DUF308 family)